MAIGRLSRPDLATLREWLSDYEGLAGKVEALIREFPRRLVLQSVFDESDNASAAVHTQDLDRILGASGTLRRVIDDVAPWAMDGSRGRCLEPDHTPRVQRLLMDWSADLARREAILARYRREHAKSQKSKGAPPKRARRALMDDIADEFRDVGAPVTSGASLNKEGVNPNLFGRVIGLACQAVGQPVNDLNRELRRYSARSSRRRR